MPEFNQDSWDFVVKSMKELDRSNGNYDRSIAGLMVSPESPFMESFGAVLDVAIGALNKLLPANVQGEDWLHYFAFDCDFGRTPLRAFKGDESRELKNYDDLKWAIYEGL